MRRDAVSRPLCCHAASVARSGSGQALSGSTASCLSRAVMSAVEFGDSIFHVRMLRQYSGFLLDSEVVGSKELSRWDSILCGVRFRGLEDPCSSLAPL